MMADMIYLSEVVNRADAITKPEIYHAQSRAVSCWCARVGAPWCCAHMWHSRQCS